MGGEVRKGIGKKMFGAKNAIEKEEQKCIDMPRNNILLQRLSNLRHVQLPNGLVFFAKYKGVNRHALVPTQVRIARRHVRKIGPRRQRMRSFGLRNKQKRR